MKKINLQRGFTLIELLVVVAIIGILSSIVLVSLNSARQRGRDASIKGSMSSMRAQAELWFDINGSYDGLQGDDGIIQLVNAVERQTDNEVEFDISENQFAASIILNDESVFCIDSNGFAGAGEILGGSVCSEN